MTDTSTVRFSLGHVVATPGALAAFRASGERPLTYLNRHVQGDWGVVDDHDGRVNEDAVRTGGARILSAYRLRTGEIIWIITEAVGDDGRRASTCLLLPDEY